jgi:hypothetical protein
MANIPVVMGAAIGSPMAYRPKWVPSNIPWGECDRERRMMLNAAWSAGVLGHLLTPSQLRTDAKMDAWSDAVGDNQKLSDLDLRKKLMGRVYVLDSARRWGKSRLLLKRALAKGIRNKGWRMIYFGPIKKELLKIVHPLMAELVRDCPPGLLGKHQGPDWVEKEEAYVFKTGSRLEIIGLDKNPDGARGTGLDAAFGDEVAFFDKLEYLINSIIMPQVMGRQHARLECASTPPVSPSHHWSQNMVPHAVADGAHDKRTIEEADQYDTSEIEEIIRQVGGDMGRKHTAVRRELFCEHVTDETLAVIPEFNYVKSEVVREITAPTWRDCYASMDPGWKDHTAVLFGYWHFEEQACVIEDEICAPRLNSGDLAAEVKRKEAFLWDGVKRRSSQGGHPKPQPFLRVTDHDPRLQQDLAMAHGLVFIPTLKDNLEQQVNAVRVAFANKKIIIHPRCTKLVLHLQNAVWKNRDAHIFAREGGNLGHFDTLAALVYLWRVMQQHKNRNPAPIEARIYAQRENTHQHPTGKPAPHASRWTRRGRSYYVR